MFRFEFADARVWRYMIASIEKILDEAVFVATGEGLSLRALDTSNVVMVDLFYPVDAFREFEVEGDEFEFGVSFPLLVKILRRARKEDSLVLEVEESRITVKFIGRGTRRFTIPEISLTHERLPEPKIDFQVEAKMLSTTFRDAIRDLEPIADVVVLQTLDEDRLILRGSGDVVSAETELSLDRGSLIEYTMEDQARASYTLEYFSYMLQAAQAADMTTIRFSEDAPVKVDLEYQAGGRLTFYVSPRVD